MKTIHLWGVRQNNLKNIELNIPLGSFTVLCGPSGSGKSSLAFETLYAEGQRRYTESLSNYSKQFLSKAPKPDIDGVSNIPPAISIEQKNSVKSSRSTVGTSTEVIDYLRLLFEKIGRAYCPHHHIPLEKDPVATASEKILKVFTGERGYLLSPILKERRFLNNKQLYHQLLQDGILRIYLPKKSPLQKKKIKKSGKGAVPKSTTKKVLAPTQGISPSTDTPEIYFHSPVGEIIDLNDAKLKRSGVPKEDFYLVIDRLAFSSEEKGRISDSLAQAYQASLKYNDDVHSGRALAVTTEGKHLFVSEDFSCSICQYSLPAVTARMFSFNSPVGACPQCKGFGNVLTVDPQKVIPNPELSLAQGALTPFTMPSAAKDRRSLLNFCKKEKIDPHIPWKDLSRSHQELIWNGNKSFFGVMGLFEFLETKKYKMHVRVFLSRYKSPFLCSTCHGSRLKPEVQQVLISGQSISDFSSMTVVDLLAQLKNIQMSPQQSEICHELYQQLLARLTYLDEVGVGYLTMDRPTKTLSGGEFQRLNLANQLGMGLSQTLYVLDEPTVGLHPRDNDRLIEILKKIRLQGNTLVIVEHDHDVIKNASHLIEMGPGSGQYGGEILFSGSFSDFLHFEKSNTLPYLRGIRNWKSSSDERPIDLDNYRYKVKLSGCSGHNLKNIDLVLPLHRLVTVTGVSGSGKSSLITGTLYPALARALNIEYVPGLAFTNLEGIEHIKGLSLIDQSPVGKTARSHPATYLKIFDAIRTIFASTPEAKAQGFTAGTFSLNVDGGRCPACKGLGHEVIDMMFMDDLQITCDICDGKKYRPEVLSVRYRGKHIGQVLDMTVAEAMDFFVAHPNIRKPLSVLREVGLDYLRLGQNANSLSGGESQRLKIARELSSNQQKSTLYILDEPTTGLHFREVHLLLGVLNRLVEAGGSVLVIEHNLEIIRHSDWVIDLGPDSALKGGEIVSASTPQDLIHLNKGYTGKYLRKYLDELYLVHSQSSSSPYTQSPSGEPLNS